MFLDNSKGNGNLLEFCCLFVWVRLCILSVCSVFPSNVTITREDLLLVTIIMICKKKISSCEMMHGPYGLAEVNYRR